MDATQILAFNAALLAALLSPGPAMLYILRTTLTQGRKAGVLAVTGLGLMAATWMACALLGLVTIFEIFPWTYVAAKTAGAAYLMWLAFRMWTQAGAPLGDAPRPAGRSVAGGVLVNLANPKSMLFAAAVLVVIFPAEISAAQKTFVVLNQLFLEWLVGGALVFILSAPAVSRRYLMAKPLIDRIAAGVMGLLGLRLLFAR
jgi:threonine/homoserine/homoserine lactone efflux protein